MPQYRFGRDVNYCRFYLKALIKTNKNQDLALGEDSNPKNFNSSDKQLLRTSIQTVINVGNDREGRRRLDSLPPLN